jgi:hypothetical protein
MTIFRCMKTPFTQSWPFKTSWLWFFAVAAVSFAAGAWSTVQLATPGKVQAQSNRVFELRVYHVAPGRLPALQTLFREHVLPMFKKHGITNIGYWDPQDKPDSENLWIYLIAHPNRKEAEKNWDAFRSDPDWQQASKAANADGKIVDKVDSTFMDPADISPLK